MTDSPATNKFERVCAAYWDEEPLAGCTWAVASDATQKHVRRGMAAMFREILADETLPDEAYDWIAELLREAGET